MLSIKQLREKDADRLAQIENPNPTPAEMRATMEKARHALRLYYRFVAAFQNSFFTSQDREATAEERQKADEKSEKAFLKASEALKPYGLKIDCPGLYPIIDYVDGRNFTHGHFYN